MPALSCHHLRRSYGPQVVLDGSSFTLSRGEKVGLIGANGTGKSTLARILAGVEVPDGGTVSVRRGLTVRYLAQEPELAPQASARAIVEEALMLWKAATTRQALVTSELDRALAEDRGDRIVARTHEALVTEQAELADTIVRLGGWERGHEALGFLNRLGVREFDRPSGERSGGERRRIAIAQLLVASPDVAILDEPTNHLDAETAEWLEQYLATEFRGAVLLVTHDRYFLDRIVTRIVELERGKIVAFEGSYGNYLEKKAELVALEERAERNRQNVLRREREWLSRGPKARGTKQKARIDRALALEARGSLTAGRPGEVSLMSAMAPRQGKTLLELRGLRVAPRRDTAPLNEPFDLSMTAGERIGIVGPNGVGKTTLLRAILAADDEDRGGSRSENAPLVVEGSIALGKNTRVAYLDQARAGLDDDKSIFEDVRGDHGSTVVDLGLRAYAALDLRRYLELFLFDGNKQRQKVGSLSGGERARVALAKALRQGANLLVFDEPTNDLDLPTLGALEELLVDFEGSILVVTHDRAFLDRVATAILAFEPAAGAEEARPACITRYAGGYQDYLAQRENVEEALAPTKSETPAPATAKPITKRGLTYAEKIELAGIVDQIDRAEKAVAEVEALLADPSLYAKRGHEVASLQARLASARTEASMLIARWEDLEAKKG